jgi:hypothetical protein
MIEGAAERKMERDKAQGARPARVVLIRDGELVRRPGRRPRKGRVRSLAGPRQHG